MKSIILFVIITFVSFSFFLFACNSGEYTYTFSKERNGYYVTGLTNKDMTEIIIPSEYKNKKVIGIAEGAFDNIKDDLKITSVTLPNTIEYIGKRAFRRLGCTQIEFPNGCCVKEIDEEAFWRSNLVSFPFSKDLTVLGKGCFRYSKLNKVDLRDCKQLKEIGNNAFNEQTMEEWILLPEGLEVFGSCYPEWESKSHVNILMYNSIKTVGRLGDSWGSTFAYIYFVGNKAEFEQIYEDSKQYYPSRASAYALYTYSETNPRSATVQAWHWVDDVPTRW